MTVNKCFEAKQNGNGNGKRSKLFRSKNRRGVKYTVTKKRTDLDFETFLNVVH